MFAFGWVGFARRPTARGLLHFPDPLAFIGFRKGYNDTSSSLHHTHRPSGRLSACSVHIVIHHDDITEPPHHLAGQALRRRQHEGLSRGLLLPRASLSQDWE